MSIKVNTRKSIHTSLKGYCYLSSDNDFMEVTEWVNGDGWDISTTSKMGSQHIALTHGELQALVVLTNYEELGNEN